MRQGVAAVTMFRGDPFWLQIWLAHYEKLLGDRSKLYVIVHGENQQAESLLKGVSKISIPFFDADPLFERRRMRFVHSFLAGLLRYYHGVIFTDTDELLCLHPAAGRDLSEYLLSQDFNTKALSSIGIELLAQKDDPPLDTSRPILQQRSHSIISAGYCKPNVMFEPIERANQHRIPGEPLLLDRNLLLFHLRYVDYERFIGTAKERQSYAGKLPQSRTKMGVGGWDDAMVDYQRKLRDCMAQDVLAFTPHNIEPILQRLEAIYHRKGRPGRRSFGHFIIPKELWDLA